MAKAKSKSRRKQLPCPVEALAIEVDELLSAEDIYKDFEKTKGEFADFPDHVQVRIGAIEDFGLTLRATSTAGALFQVGLVMNKIDDLINGTDAARERVHLDYLLLALNSVASVFKIHTPVWASTRALMYYTEDVEHRRFCTVLDRFRDSKELRDKVGKLG